MLLGNRTYVATTETFSFLKPILREWCCLTLKYAAAHKDEGDVPWWYGERSYTGFLSASAWLHGAIALEEWGTPKVRQGRKSAGRGDIYILSNDRKYRLCCEAKKITLRAERGVQRWQTQVAAALKRAVRDSRCVRVSKPEIPVGIVFAEFVVSCSTPSQPKVRRAASILDRFFRHSHLRADFDVGGTATVFSKVPGRYGSFGSRERYSIGAGLILAQEFGKLRSR
jgi:hypothetical protein